jgi:uncharacterized protein YjbI with pentapeptide repeats
VVRIRCDRGFQRSNLSWSIQLLRSPLQRPANSLPRSQVQRGVDLLPKCQVQRRADRLLKNPVSRWVGKLCRGPISRWVDRLRRSRVQRGWGADFQEAEFRSETTDFREAKFSGKWTYFERAEFIGKAMSFSEAKFSCEETSFKGAKFRERAWFWGTKNNPVFSPQAGVSFEQCRIEKPELLTFNTVLLHPSSFINTDVRNVDFTDVKWYGMPGGPEGTLEEEIDALTKRDIESPHILLSQTCQRLSANAEENREYPLANEFYYWSMDALRKKGRRSFGPIRTLYWALSGYGVRARRAFLVLLAMWAAFTILYGLVDPPGFEKFGQGISYVWQSAVYSLLALARLNPEPRPELPGLFQFLVGLEGLLGPLQIGLLLLAIRRQVMR